MLGRLHHALILLVVMIEDLDLHAGVRDIAGKGRANADAVIRARSHLELEVEDEVIELIFGQEIPAAIFWAYDDAVLNDVSGAFLADQSPAFQVFAVEQRRESGASGEHQQTGNNSRDSYFAELGNASDLHPFDDVDIAGVIEACAVRANEFAGHKCLALFCAQCASGFRVVRLAQDA